LGKIVLSALLFFFGFNAQAQNFTINGRAQDGETRSAIQGGTVILKSIKDTNLLFTTYTDTAGRYQFDQLSADFFSISISSIGYETILRNVRIDSINVDMGVIEIPRSSEQCLVLKWVYTLVNLKQDRWKRNYFNHIMTGPSKQKLLRSIWRPDAQRCFYFASTTFISKALFKPGCGYWDLVSLMRRHKSLHLAT
jgi:hypothetical protein